MFQKILVPLDGSALSEQTLGYAAAIAKAASGSLILLHVVDTAALEQTGQMWVELPSLKQIVDEEIARAETYLQSVKQRLEAQGLKVETHTGIGPPASVIESVVAEVKPDLVAMSTHGRGGVARMVLGSVADKVIHDTVVPLLLYRPTEGTPATAAIKNIIVPLDGSTLAEQSLPVAEDFAKAFNAGITLFRAVSTYTFAFAEPYPYGGAEVSVELLEAIEQEADDYVNTQATALRAKGFVVDPKRMLGDPATLLVDLAHDTADSLTVITSHGRSGVVRTILGSVADRVVRNSGRPVLVVRVKE